MAQPGITAQVPMKFISFPAHQENPFQIPFCNSDLVLIVEGQKLHVHKIVLSLYSPVFRAMFDRDFAEKDACEIELEEVKCEAMVQFLKMMYPVHSHTPIANDSVLEDSVYLADFYDCAHVRIKCEDYIWNKVQDPKSISSSSKMFYLWICDKFNLKYKDFVLDVASQLRIEEIKNEHFEQLHSDTRQDLLERRCQIADGKMHQVMSHFNSSYLNPRRALGQCMSCERKLEKENGCCSKCLVETVNEML